MYSEKVDCGIDRLNDHYGNTDWQQEINRDTLRIDDFYQCVLAQLFGNYSAGCRELGITRNEEISCGFDVVMGEDDPDELTAAWLDALT